MRLRLWKKLKQNVADGNERGAREALLEELFNDFNRNRFTVYKINFFRGISFGLGSILGGTVVVALIIAGLTWTGQLIPGVAGFVHDVVEIVQKKS